MYIYAEDWKEPKGRELIIDEFLIKKKKGKRLIEIKTVMMMRKNGQVINMQEF